MLELYHRSLRCLIWLLAGISGCCLIGMILVTCLDILLRRFASAVPGAVDMVQIMGCLAVTTALPYTTAVKGHIAVEFLFRHLPLRLRIILDTCTRLMVMAAFIILSWRSWLLGLRMLHKNSVSMTQSIPLFWVLWVMSFSFAVVILVKIYNITHPGKELIRP